MVIKRTFGEKSFDRGNVIFLIFLMVLTLYPFLYVIFASFSDSTQLSLYTGLLYAPLGFSLDAYKAVFNNEYVFIGYRNTLFYVGIGTMINMVMTLVGAFLVSRKSFYWKKMILSMVIITMFFNGGLIPTYLVMKQLNLINTIWAILLPGAISSWNLLIMRTAFQGIPDSLEEAAKIDGANEFYVFIKIAIPLTIPTIMVLILYYAVAHWNSWFSAMVYLRDRELFPLQLFLREMLIARSVDDMVKTVGEGDKENVAETIKYATIMVATLPILFAYPFVQKYFVKGVMIGAVKG